MLEKQNYTVLISAKDDATKNLNVYLRRHLARLGVQSDLEGKYRYSFIAVLENGEAMYEDMGEMALAYQGTFSDGTSYVIKSAGCDVGNTSSPRSLKTEISGERFFRPARSRSAGVAALRQAESDTVGRKKIRQKIGD